MPLESGTRLGPYEVLSVIGAGGMGEVYKARDTRLNRIVAVKVLPTKLSAHPELRARFKREAEAVAALNHPHICALYDVGQDHGIDYIVMEYLEGGTLAARLRKGGLDLNPAIEIAIAIADALDRAHSAGIVHRDLKPGNVMLTKSGAKLMDFGLARTLPAQTGSAIALSQIPTGQASEPLTAAGSILGTLEYMAPEQLDGHEADARSDIFALGVLIYEMVTGSRAFEAKSRVSLIAAILEHQPPAMSSIEKLTPASLDHLVEGCLAKNPDERWQTARDVLRDLRWIASGSQRAETSSSGVPARRRERVLLGIVAFLILAVIGMGLSILFGGASPDQPLWFTILPPNSNSGVAPEAVMAPDGRSVAFSAQNEAGVRTLWVRPLDSPSARELPGTEGDWLPFWSPDGKSLGFFADGKLKRIDVTGGAPQVLANAPSGRGGAWGPDGTIVYSPSETGLYRIPASGGNAAPLTQRKDDESYHGYPQFLPDGRTFLFLVRFRSAAAHLFVGSIDSQSVKPVQGSIRSRGEYRDGYVVYAQNGVILADKLELRSLAVSGRPVRVADGVGISYGTTLNSAFSTAQDTLVFSAGSAEPYAHLLLTDRQGRRLAGVGNTGEILGLAKSRVGDHLALEMREPEKNAYNVWLSEVTNPVLRRFSSGANWVGTPVWAPDGSVVAFVDFDSGQYQFKQVRDEKSWSITYQRQGGWLQDWSGDGRYVVIARDTAEGGSGLFLLPAERDGVPRTYLNTPFNERSASVSPDGRWIAYVSDETGKAEVFIQSFPEPGHKMRISQDGGEYPVWRPDGQELFFIRPDRKLAAARLHAASSGLETEGPVALFETPGIVEEPMRHQYAVLDNGQRFLFNARDESAPPRSITVVRNWKSLLRN